MTDKTAADREQLASVYDRYREVLPPQRVISTVEDVYEAIDEYDAYLSGIVQSVLAGEPLPVDEVDSATDIDVQLLEAEQKMAALREHWDRIGELRAALLKVLGEAG